MKDQFDYHNILSVFPAPAFSKVNHLLHHAFISLYTPILPSHTFLPFRIGTLGFVDFFELVLGDLWTSFLPKWSRITVDS